MEMNQAFIIKNYDFDFWGHACDCDYFADDCIYFIDKFMTIKIV